MQAFKLQNRNAIKINYSTYQQSYFPIDTNLIPPNLKGNAIHLFTAHALTKADNLLAPPNCGPFNGSSRTL